ncbi:hypothetical protein LWI29_020579 [Acer saccharum]|uniref:Retrovirus-related Pol polyprotein from transposon TNT 1-94-like beta-barrel domain-containing protein n=1 Tax=Acer saccharum TaxID=4024 RepID=A0AA39VZL5_ACESA|nr:hypothetical protein LWI29_020579 [Acer saccharum]
MSSTSNMPVGSSSSLIPNITNSVYVRLDRTNYPLWLAQIVPLLRSKNLQKYVNGESSCPPAFVKDDSGKDTTTVNPAYQEWIQHDQLVLSWINGSLSLPLLSTVARYNSAREVWVSLEERFASQNQQRVIELRSELVTTRRGDLSISDFLDKVHAIADNLSLSGSPISDQDLVAIIMSNVGPLYENTVASVQARETPITYSGLETLLLSAERRLNSLQQQQAPTESTVAMTATRGGQTGRGSRNYSRYNGGRGSFRGRGSNGGGSFPSNIRVSSSSASNNMGATNSRNSSGSFSNGNRLQCQICNRMGHSAIDCYNHMNHAYEGRIPTQRLSAMISTSAPFGSQSWLTDTGANAHITTDDGNLLNPREYRGQDTIGGVLGGSGLPINSIGHSYLSTDSSTFPLSDVHYCPQASHNILSVHKFANDNNCSFIFFS